MGKSKPSPAVAYNSSRRCCLQHCQMSQRYTLLTVHHASLIRYQVCKHFVTQIEGVLE